MSLKSKSDNAGVAWVLVVGVLGVMSLGAWLVVEGHGAGWGLIILPLVRIFL